MPPTDLLLLIQAAATWMMTGLIWFVQVVHYPLFARVGEQRFAEYAIAHQRQTTWVVGPPMLVEAGLAVWCLVQPPRGVPSWMLWTGVALLAVIWLSTALLQVPAHGLLGERFDAAVGRRLVQTNWIRTAAWTARGVLLLVILVQSRE